MQITTIGLDIAKNVFQVHGRPIHAAASKVRAALCRVRCQLLHNGSWRRIDDDLGVYPTELLCDRFVAFVIRFLIRRCSLVR
jgi:hypothetical protein